MNKLLCTAFLATALIGGCFLFKVLPGLRSSAVGPLALFERGSFVHFEHENVDIYVPRFDETIPRFTGEILDGHLFLQVHQNAGLQLEGVSTGCGCSVVRPVEGQQNAAGLAPLEMAFSVNTIGRVGPQDFPLTFKFRDLNGGLKHYQARLQFVLDRGIETPPVTDAVLLEDDTKTFSRTWEIRSKIPNIQWKSVEFIVTGGKAVASLSPLGEKDGFSVAEVSLSGQVSDISGGGLTIVFESSQFKEQPKTVIPFVKSSERFIWKPESLEFRDPQALPKLLVQTKVDCVVDDLSLSIDRDQLNYQIKKVGKVFVIEFQLSDATSFSATGWSSGVIRLLHKDSVVATISYQWSEK